MHKILVGGTEGRSNTGSNVSETMARGAVTAGKGYIYISIIIFVFVVIVFCIIFFVAISGKALGYGGNNDDNNNNNNNNNTRSSRTTASSDSSGTIPRLRQN